MGQPRRVIGVDLDNTIINYDDSCHGLAVIQGWLPRETAVSKRAVRDALRAQPDGEMRWRRLQAWIYGPRMDLAQPMPGALHFLRACREANVEVRIVSHKTRFANAFDTGVDLRQAALGWLESQGFLSGSDGPLKPEDVWFESDRSAKGRRIAALGCELFIDDLDEVFSDASFPAGVGKILLTSTVPRKREPGVVVCAHWREITEHVLSA
jgi:hypothetical protein